MTRCSCGFEGSYGIVWAHCMNVNDTHVHKIQTEEAQYSTIRDEELIVCEKCGSILGIKDGYFSSEGFSKNTESNPLKLNDTGRHSDEK